MIDYMEEMRANNISELRFTMNGKELKVKKATVLDGKRMELSLTSASRRVKGVHPSWKIDHGSPDTQKKAIRDYLMAGYSITPLEALEMFGCFRLAAQVASLKKDGLPIAKEMRKDKDTGKRYAAYSLSPKKNEEETR